MKNFRTAVSIIVMMISALVGFFIGSSLNEPLNGAILFSMIAGFACIIYAIDNRDEQ